MGYKTILVHCDAGKTSAVRIRVAFDLGRRFDAHVLGVYVRPRFEAPAFSDGTMAMDALYRNYESSVKGDEAKALATFESAAGGKGSSQWRIADGYPDDALAELAHGADLLIVGQREPEPAPMGSLPNLAERLALSSERPILVIPHIGVASPPGRTVLLCWNGRREAGRAAAGALPLLKKADKVIVLTIDAAKESESDDRHRTAADPVEWLTRHGVKATLQRDSAADTDIGNVILSRAADSSADLIVMGIYGHSRMREMVMGGASRTVLASMTVPILMAH
jgi:nucleotide-binding universal stress UspA family protein